MTMIKEMPTNQNPEKEKIEMEMEKERARKNFKELINLVEQRYKKSRSMSPEIIEDFTAHNEDVLTRTIELGMKKGLSPQELKLAEIAAIIHDLTKGDAPPKNAQNIENYVLATHAETAAQKVDDLVTSEILEKAEVDVKNKESAKIAKNQIKAAVRQHMGPHPGFMDFILISVNRDVEIKNKILASQNQELIPQIEHPQAEGKISETLLAADMASLASMNGRKKIMDLRSENIFFNNQDQNTQILYKKFGIDLKQGEAALLSGFDSATDASKMIQDEKDKEYIKSLIDQSKKYPYAFRNQNSGETEIVTWHEAIKKRIEFLTQYIPDEIERNKKQLEQARKELSEYEQK